MENSHCRPSVVGEFIRPPGSTRQLRLSQETAVTFVVWGAPHIPLAQIEVKNNRGEIPLLNEMSAESPYLFQSKAFLSKN
jgi:hypothetical protein